MVVLTVKTPAASVAKSLRMKLATFLSVGCTAFFVANTGCMHCYGTPLVKSVPITAIVEWADVMLVLVWFCSYTAKTLANYRLGFVAIPATSTSTPTSTAAPTSVNAASPSPRSRKALEAGVDGEAEAVQATAAVTILNVQSMQSMTNWATVLCLGTTLLTWAFAVKDGVVEKGVFPIISDLWWSPPGNWFSRWGVVLGATMMYVHEINLYFVNTGPSGNVGVAAKAESALLMVLGIAGAFGLSVVGCVDNHENDTIHEFAAAAFFCLYDLYMLLYVVRSTLLGRASKGALPAFCCFVLATACKLRFFEVSSAVDSFVNATIHSDVVGRVSGQSWFALYEWADMATVLLFINLTAKYSAAKGTSLKHGLAIYTVPPHA